MSLPEYDIFIDTGGTFTDCIALDTEGKIQKKKVLSNGSVRGHIKQWLDARTIIVEEKWALDKDILSGYGFKLLDQEHEITEILSYNPQKHTLVLSDPLPDHFRGRHLSFEVRSGEEAPVLAARMVTGCGKHDTIPVRSIKLGSTKGTNALLERKGSKLLFIVTRGFGDVLEIGYQDRPDIFARHVIKPRMLYTKVLEIDERIDCQGNVLHALDLNSLFKRIQETIASDEFDAVAVALMNAYKNPIHEEQTERILSQVGFEYVSISSRLSGQIKYIPRAETAVVNAYLQPIISTYIENIGTSLKPVSFHIMNSAGGLVKASSFNPKDSLLSGPAGGVVGASAVGLAAGFEKILSFDMGGTSTDVARFDGRYDYKFELKVGDARIFSPALSIETVAAGGGSICKFDGYKLCVGPDSAGANPGPACYGAGGPLTLTDVNLLLGRLDVDQFGIPVSSEFSANRLNELIQEIYEKTGEKRQPEELLVGFLRIANEIMAGAIQKVSVSKGYDPASYALVAFGGAGGMHAGQISEILGITTILLPMNAGLLSAYGISVASIDRMVERQLLQNYDTVFPDLEEYFTELETTAIGMVADEGIPRDAINIRERNVYLRHVGQDATIEVAYSKHPTPKTLYKEKFTTLYGYWTSGGRIEVESIRVIATSELPAEEREQITFSDGPFAEPVKKVSTFHDRQWIQIPVYLSKQLRRGQRIEGFALILDEYSTWVIEKNWTLEVGSGGSCIMTLEKKSPGKLYTPKRSIEEVELELFTNRFMSIANNMGSMLQRTSVSVNIKERLDFSCALVDAQGQLVANAPHIPVHLGSLGVCVRAVVSKMKLSPGDTLITNHPAYGGSHLPDITLITPVFSETEKLIGYVVNRAHHAEIGGRTPASMPPDARSLAEEGVVIYPDYLIRNHEPRWDRIRQILLSGKYPSRAVEENLADLKAALAANINGREALLEMVQFHGLEQVMRYMDRLRKHAAQKMRDTLHNIPDGIYESEERLDDGSPLKARICIKDGHCDIDFSGTGPVHNGNMNATLAIVHGVVIYVMRLLINEPLPLNDGIMEPLHLSIPDGLLNPDFSGLPEECPAIVGGNVEVSQRLTDTLLKPFNIMACSQGTMNNVLFGNDHFSYYETLCGGCGASKESPGASGVHHHMTNTRITDPEILEFRYPVRLELFQIRSGSGGAGFYHGGNGVIRAIRFLEDVSLSVLSQHRVEQPYGILKGEPGMPGSQYIVRLDGSHLALKSVDGANILKGELFYIHTPGGGGWGHPEKRGVNNESTQKE